MAAGAAFVLVVVGVSCEPKQQTTPLPLTYSGYAGGPRVGFVGDSITRLAAPNILARMQAGFQVNLQYKDGQTIASMLPALVAQLRDRAVPRSQSSRTSARTTS